MMRAALILAVALCLAGMGAALAGYDDLPAETATLAAGPNLATVQANCAGCHSADYITTQPRSFADPRAFWGAEVARMRKAYGAPIAQEDVQPIVDYLTATYGR